MNKMYYCMDCRKIFDSNDKCPHCASSSLKELVKKAPVNVTGTKLKGRLLKIDGQSLNILFYGDGGKKSIKQYEASQLRKLL